MHLPVRPRPVFPDIDVFILVADAQPVPEWVRRNQVVALLRSDRARLVKDLEGWDEASPMTIPLIDAELVNL